MNIKDYRKELQDQLIEIQELIKKSNRNVARYKDLPNSHVYISNSNGCPQYYLKTENGDKQYIKKKYIKDITKFAQRDYEIDINQKLKQLESKLQRFLASYDISFLNEYDRFSEPKKAILKSFVMSEEQMIEKWYESNGAMQNSFYGEGIYQTNRGEMVRSKSEKIIADTLEKYNVPYKYEPLLELGYSTVFPDFAVLNVRNNKTLYWEHLGLIADDDYAIKNFRKIQLYEKSGYIHGKDLITTMESEDAPLEIKVVEQKIKEFLL